MNMDMKRFTEIGGREALERLTNGLDIYNNVGVKIKIDFEKLDYTWQTSDNMVYFGEEVNRPITLVDLLKETWYVKKPFDVRKEMLERPDSWVGAFRGADGRWHKVGFDTEFMTAVETPFVSTVKVNFDQASVAASNYEELEKCIPIEDVPKEEWK